MNSKTHQKLTTSQGFTLTELIIVIVIMGIIAAVVAPLIGNKFSAVAQSTKRAQWVQQAEYALTQLRQDLAVSVPNLVFTGEPVSGNDQVVEFLSGSVGAELYAARYRNRNLSGQDRLQPNNDDSFDIFGTFTTAPAWLSIGNASALQGRQDWESARAGGSNGNIAGVQNITAGTGENGSPVSNVELSANHRFGGHSSYFRAYFFDGPVGYECDSASGFLYRVSGYDSLSTTADFATRTSGVNVVRNRVISNLISCDFTLVAGTLYSPPGVEIKLEIGEGQESITLYDTIRLSNAS